MALALTACYAPEIPKTYPVQPQPNDTAVAALYERSCMQCHTRKASGAPQVGDLAAWKSRKSMDVETQIASVRNGMGAMPPMGLCPDCSDDDLRHLIAFLKAPVHQ